MPGKRGRPCALWPTLFCKRPQWALWLAAWPSMCLGWDSTTLTASRSNFLHSVQFTPFRKQAGNETCHIEAGGVGDVLAV